MSRYANAFRLIGIGLSAWTVAVVGGGLAVGFWSLAVCRMLVGVGEASFVALASPFIGAPTRHRVCGMGCQVQMHSTTDLLSRLLPIFFHNNPV